MKKVYVVARRSADIAYHMVEIIGIYASEDEADKHREYMWDEYEIETQVESFLLLDLIAEQSYTETKGEEPMPHPHKNRPRKGRRKIGSKKRKAQSNNRKK